MLKIGLTGGIGSGKTTVSGIIAALGYPVYNSDHSAARVVNENEAVRNALIKHFGSEIYPGGGGLDRPRFAAIVFDDPVALARANGIIHPAVMDDFHGWCASRRSPLLFLESAILFESGLAGAFDATITVVADLETRVERVMSRDGVSREKVLARARHQAAGDISRSTFVIRDNPGEMLLEQVLDVIHTLETWQE